MLFMQMYFEIIMLAIIWFWIKYSRLMDIIFIHRSEYLLTEILIKLLSKNIDKKYTKLAC